MNALSNVNFDVKAGEVVGLVGDNGAGKSTLLKILSGALQPTSGHIVADGEEVTFTTPHVAREHGVSAVYQDLALAPQRDVVSNFFLGKEVLRTGVSGTVFRRLDRPAMRSKVISELARLKTNLPSVDVEVRNLSGGQRQTLAIARAASWCERVLLLDEPTSALGVAQQAEVLQLITRVAESGIGVIFISHQMKDVLAVCDRIFVLRLGRIVAELDARELDAETLIGYITGAIVQDRSSENLERNTL
ncbi:ATP-binding cassette domain-containing protein [Naasia lichenicola]|uniref:ATP-binding cassette domain-containing protein n=1 Tax=Naasia lichenicola TaxID=2565933 RepID=UPI001E620FA0|nr:ATP-binding cassette domain-containing protein [Naasia lichenicola]